MHIFITCLLLLICFRGSPQDRLFSCGNNGEIIEFNTQSCSTRSLGVYDVFGDIAVTSDGTIYGISDRLYQIDTLSQNALAISPQLITNIGGLGLMVLNDSTLLYDKSDSLYLYDLVSNNEMLLGVVGFNTNGDFATYNGNIYMVSLDNELIKITLNSSNDGIQSITNIGVLNTHSMSAYSIFNTYLSCPSDVRGLFVIDETTIYLVDETSANVHEICVLPNQQFSFGSATLFGNDNDSFLGIIPNVFTPNGDGVNDAFVIEDTNGILTFQIINRWGNSLYSWNSGPLIWNGKIEDNEEASEGVYFYLIQYVSCSDEIKKTGHITLLR